MDRNEKFLHVQNQYIQTAKYYEGFKIRKDPGDDFVFNFVVYNSEDLRKKWSTSKCQYCNSWKECGHMLKVECQNFKFDDEENEN